MYDWIKWGKSKRPAHQIGDEPFDGPDWCGREKRLEPSGELAR